MSDIHKEVMVIMNAEEIPKENNKEFEEWCKDRGFYCMNGDLRAWCSQLSTYIRDETHLLWFNGIPVALCNEEILMCPSELDGG